MNRTGKIVVLAYPDTFVTMSDEWICRLLPLVGLGTRKYIKAGHAALVLIEDATGVARYYDFGRYITPDGYGRVRSAETDVELGIPFHMEVVDGQLKNLDRLLLWLEAHPQKTHGEGRLLASVCEDIDYQRALEHILALQDRGVVPYGAFVGAGSNCSRFVTDTILASTGDSAIVRRLRFNKRFTPSTVGNVEKAAHSVVYEVLNQEVRPFDGSAFRENLKNYFDRKPKALRQAPSAAVVDAQKLEGIGSGAWFQWVESTGEQRDYHRIRRFNDLGELDFDGVFHSTDFDPGQAFEFTYLSHCKVCHVIQGGRKIALEGMGDWATFSSMQKVRSA